MSEVYPAIAPQSFRTEKELQSTMVNIELDLDLEGDYSVTYFKREVSLGGCIPDLVYVRFDNIPDYQLFPTKWSSRHANVMWLLRKWGAMTLRAIADISFSPESRIAKTVRELIKTKAIFETSDGRVKLADELLQVKSEVVAVEAKLRDWKRALQQAQEYTTFADRVFVVMDAKWLPQNKAVTAEFEQNGIGLCSLSPNSDNFNWHVIPRKKHQPTRFIHEYILASAITPSSYADWSCRYEMNAVCHA